jgi:hypothetical protein
MEGKCAQRNKRRDRISGSHEADKGKNRPTRREYHIVHVGGGLLGNLGYRQRQHPYAPAEEVGHRALHFGSEQCGLCERRAKAAPATAGGGAPSRERV